MNKLEDIFKIEKREVKGINPVTKEEITINRTYYIFNDIEFCQDKNILLKLQKLDLTDEEYDVLRNSLKDFIDVVKEEIYEYLNLDEENKILDEALKMQDSEALRLYFKSACADLLLSYLNDSFTEDEVRKMTNSEVEVKIFKALLEDEEEDEDE